MGASIKKEDTVTERVFRCASIIVIVTLWPPNPREMIGHRFTAWSISEPLVQLRITQINTNWQQCNEERHILGQMVVLINCILNQSIVKNDWISFISIIASHQVILLLTSFLIHSSNVAIQCSISAYLLWLLVKAKWIAYFPFGEMSIFKKAIKVEFKTQAKVIFIDKQTLFAPAY